MYMFVEWIPKNPRWTKFRMKENAADLKTDGGKYDKWNKSTTDRQLPRLSCIPGAPFYRRLRVAALRTQPDLNTDDPWKTKNNPDFPLETE